MKRCVLPVSVLLLALACQLPDPGSEAASDKCITSFSIVSPAVEGVVDEQALTIGVEVPAGTSLSALVAEFAFTGVSVDVGGVAQHSGLSANDFSAPVSYVVSAEDGSTATYAVTVRPAAALRTEKSLTSFGFLDPSVEGQIDQAALSVRVAVPHGTDLSSLAAVYTTTGARVTVDDTEQESGITVNDFSEPRSYLVHAEDGSTAAYVVTVECTPSAEKALTSFAIQSPRAAGAIDQATGIVRIRLPPGTPLGALVAEFSTTGVSVTAGGAVQESGVSVVDFSQPVEYVVHAEDGSTAAYGVRVLAGIDLLINELDVDQVGTDNAELIELYAGSEVDLYGVVLAQVNGGVSPGQEYARVDLSSLGTLPAGGYLVIAGSAVPVPPGAVKHTPTGWELTNRIQNGPNDAVILFDTLGKRVIDSVTYNGVLHRAVLAGEPGEWDATEGAAGAPADSNTVAGSLSRIPNGQDTGQNGADFRFSPVVTPGTANGQ